MKKSGWTSFGRLLADALIVNIIIGGLYLATGIHSLDKGKGAIITEKRIVYEDGLISLKTEEKTIINKSDKYKIFWTLPLGFSNYEEIELTQKWIRTSLFFYKDKKGSFFLIFNIPYQITNLDKWVKNLNAIKLIEELKERVKEARDNAEEIGKLLKEVEEKGNNKEFLTYWREVKEANQRLAEELERDIKNLEGKNREDVLIYQMQSTLSKVSDSILYEYFQKESEKNPSLKLLPEEEIKNYIGKEISKNPEILVEKIKESLKNLYFQETYGISINEEEITYKIMEYLMPYQR